jgi:hypothetical protein
LQQGLPAPGPGACTVLAGALLFQPRVIGVVVIVLTVLQYAPGFLVLAGLLYWSALFPRWNPFEAVYRVLTRKNPGAATLPLAAPPRRFAQTLAGTTAALIGLAILGSQGIAAYALEAFLLVALAALSIGRFCFGSFFYYLLRGQFAFAIRTLPWGRGV